MPCGEIRQTCVDAEFIIYCASRAWLPPAAPLLRAYITTASPATGSSGTTWRPVEPQSLLLQRHFHIQRAALGGEARALDLVQARVRRIGVGNHRCPIDIQIDRATSVLIGSVDQQPARHHASLPSALLRYMTPPRRFTTRSDVAAVLCFAKARKVTYTINMLFQRRS